MRPATLLQRRRAPAAARPAFSTFELSAGVEVHERGEYPTMLRTWRSSVLHLPADGTHYVYALDHGSKLESAAWRFELAAGMFAAVPGPAHLHGGAGIAVTRLGYRGAFLLGGPLEPTGRLRYIDGCTDSLLLAPAVLGDPCLNHLHIPNGTHQTQHTHASVRVGVIARGRGRCVTPEGDHPLEPGRAFIIPAHRLHSFHTDGESLDVVVYHPDTDTGPTHEDHPMVNRTIVPPSRGRVAR